MYLFVARETKHAITVADGGGRFLTLMVPGGLEKMFFELGTPAPNAIRDPVARAAISAHEDLSLLLAEGAPPHVVQQIVGHSAIDVTMTIYAHASLDEKRTALSRLGERLA